MQTYHSNLIDVRGLDIFTLLAAALAPAPSESSRRSPEPNEAAVQDPRSERSWLERIDQWFWDRRQRDVEAYLAGSADIYELEARQRALERNVPQPY